MWIPIIGLVIGLLIGLFIPFTIPINLSKYFSIAILAGLDTALGGLKANLKQKFNLTVFISGFTCNIIVAIVLVYLGEILGIDLYLAAIIVFGVRLFNNATIIRRILLNRLFHLG